MGILTFPHSGFALLNLMVDLTPPYTGQQPMAQPRPAGMFLQYSWSYNMLSVFIAAPQTPQRSPTRERGREQVDAEGSVSITISIPANLAAETDVSVVVTPRSARIARGGVLPQVTPLRFQPAVPGPPLPATPSPSPLPSPFRFRPRRREPVVCLH